MSSRVEWRLPTPALVALVVAALLAPAPAPAHAAFAGANGRIVFTWDRNDEFELWMVNADGTGLKNLTREASDDAAQFSPDGTRLAFHRQQDGSGIYVMDLSRPESAVNLTAGMDGFKGHPTWSPDGTRLAFSRSDAGGPDIYVLNLRNPSAPPVQITTDPGSDAEPAWSPDGTRIAFTSDRDGDDEIYTMRPDGSSVEQLTTSAAPDMNPTWSPEGSRLAFTSLRDGNLEVYTMTPRVGAPQDNVSDNPADERYPAWSPDGTKLVFTSNRGGGSHVVKIRADGSGPIELAGSPFFMGYADWGRGAAPTAAFGIDPPTPTTGQTVTFSAAASSDPDGTVATYTWDLDGDGSFEAQGLTASRSFGTSGSAPVRLRITDHDDNVAETAGPVAIADRPPIASFVMQPNPVSRGQRVTLDGSSSSDPDGRIARYQWDTDGDGVFETDTGAVPRATHRYRKGRNVRVRLRVTDDRGNTGEVVAAHPLRILTRRLEADATLAYFDTPRGIRIRSLVVRKIPKGARVEVRCIRRRRDVCRRRLSDARAAPLPRDRGRLRFTRLRGARLRAGTRVEIRVTKPDFIGVYVVYRVRRGGYRREEACLPPGSRAPRRVCGRRSPGVARWRRGEVADLLRPFYLEYLRRHGVNAPRAVKPGAV